MSDMSLMLDLVKARWSEWARLRFTPGEKRERRAWAKFISDTEQCYSRLKAEAEAAGASLDYTVWHVRKLVLVALEASCRCCERLFGIDSWSVTYVIPPRRGGPCLYRMRNLAVYCKRCGDAKGQYLSESEWIDLQASLRGADEVAAADVLDRLIAGTVDLPLGTRREGGQGRRVYVIRSQEEAGRPGGGAKVLPHPRRLRVTREPRPSPSCSAKK